MSSEKKALILFIFGTVIRQNSNYGHHFIHLVCCDISEKNGLIVFIFSTVIKYHVLFWCVVLVFAMEVIKCLN